MALSISSKIIRNTIYNSAGRFWGIVVSVVMTPYIIAHIGLESFGLWAVVGVITSYFGLMDFGVSSSFVKYFSEFYTKKDFRGMNRLICTGLVFYSILGILIVTIAVSLVGVILHIFKIPPYLYGHARFVIILGIALFCVSSALGIFIAVLQGIQRMDISNSIAIAASFVNIAGIIFFLRSGYGIRGLMVNNVIVFAFIALFSIIWVLKTVPQIRFSLFAWDTSLFKRSFSFGYKMQIAKISGMFSTQADKILIAYFLSLGLVTYFQLGSTVVYSAISLISLLVSALLPAFSEIEAKGNKVRLVEAYLRSAKYVSFFVAPVFVFLFLSAGRVIFIWMGAGYSRAAYIIQILTIAWALNAVARVGSAASMAIEKPGLMARSSVLTIILHLSLSIILIKYFGFYGVAWGAAIAVNIGAIYFLLKLNSALSISFGRLFKNLIPFFLIAIFSAVIICLGDLMLVRFVQPINRIGSFFVLCIEGFIFISFYMVFVYLKKIFGHDELDLLRQKVPIFRPFFK